MAAQEDPPRLIIPGWRRDAVGPQDLADGGGSYPVPEPAQLALDPDHTPPGVLSRQAHDQPDKLIRNRRTARWSGLTPLRRHQPPVPAQQCAGSHDPPGPQRLRHNPRERGEHGPVGPGHARPRGGPAQHGHLVPQREYLHILGPRGPGQQRQPGQHRHQQPVYQHDKHGCRSCRRQSPRSNQRPSIRPLQARGGQRSRTCPIRQFRRAGSPGRCALPGPGRKHRDRPRRARPGGG